MTIDQLIKRVLHFTAMLAAALTLSAVHVSAAQASVISFDGEGDQFLDPLFSGGFTFDFTASGWCICTDSSAIGLGFPSSGSDIMGMDGFVDMTDTSGTAFSLQSFMGANRDPTSGGTKIFVDGTLSGGGSVNAEFTTVGGIYSTFVLPSSFTNLSSVRFSTDRVGFGLDDITVNQPASVPEPGTLALLGLGLAGLAAARRRKQ